jgi:endonuclease-3
MPLRIDKIFEKLSEVIVNPVSELNYKNEYTFCIAVLLSAQSTDKSVNLATGALFNLADTAEKMLEFGEERLLQHIRTIGLCNTKCRNIIALSKMLVAKHNSRIPRKREDLEALPGIGRKSANVILNTLFGIDCIAVDTHVLRVSNRLGLTSARTPLGVEDALTRVVPARFRKTASNLLVLHGRYTCTARLPKCATCCISGLCPQKLAPLVRRP